MKKNLTLQLVLFLFSCLTLYSCIHDDMSSDSDHSSKEYTSKEYTSKSPWKEDEKYIKNVKKIFEQYSNPEYFSGKFGTVLWNYAITMGTEETFLEVPVIKNNTVNFILLVYKDGDRVYFKRKEEENSKLFFNNLVFKDRKQLTDTKLSNSLTPESRGGCVSVTTTWTWTNTETGAVEHVSSTTEMYCLPAGPALPCQSVDVDGTCGGSTGGGGGGYPYPGGGGGGGGTTIPVGAMSPPPPPDLPLADVKKFLSCLNITQPANLTVYAAKMFSSSASGHAFISITQGGNTMTFGFYPKNGLNQVITGPGIFGNDSGHAYTHSLNVGSITPTQLQQIIAATMAYSGGTYDLGFNNCADFTLTVLGYVGFNTDTSGVDTPNTVTDFIESNNGSTTAGSGPQTHRTCN